MSTSALTPGPVGASARRCPLLPCLLLALYLLLTALVLPRHEPWHDEAQAWLLARDCPTPGALLGAMRYERHPALWHLLLFPLAQTGAPYASMAVLHALLAFLAVTWIALRSPFNGLEKGLLVLSFYFAYEYNLIARNYVLASLVLLALAWQYPRRLERPWQHGLLLGLLCNTHLLAAVLSVGFAAVWGWELLVTEPRRRWRRLLVGGAPYLAGAALLAWQTRSPADSPLSLFTITDVSTLLGAPSRLLRPLADAYVPLGGLLHLPLRVQGLLGLLGLGAAALVVTPPAVRLRLLLSSLLLLAFLVIYGDSQLRHHGLLFIAFVCCLWMARSEAPARPRRWLTAALLLPGLLSTGVAMHHELAQSFSGAREAAAFVRREGYLATDTFIASYGSQNCIGMLPYLPRDTRFYQLEYGRPGSFIVWNRQRSQNANWQPEEAARRLEAVVAERRYRAVVLLLGTNEAPETLGPYRRIALFGPGQGQGDTIAIYRRG